MNMDNLETGKVDSKGRKVFKDSKGRTHVKQGDKKVYVKKLFTPKRSLPPVTNTRSSSPVINTGKVNAKQRPVFKDSKGRTYVKQGDKKVYVKKMFTPHPLVKHSTVSTPVAGSKISRFFKEREKQTTPPKKLNVLSQIKLDCSTPAGLGQTKNTCWFNASLNGFILGEATAKMILNQIKQLSSSEIDALMKDFPSDSCPIALSRKYVYSYFLKIHSGTQITGKKGNAAVGLMNRLFTPKALSTPTATGKVGGHPADAALKILSKVFPNGTTGTLLDWETVCPNSFSKYAMVYRKGAYFKRDKWLTPDMHPLVIKTVDGETKFKLSHMVYVVNIGKLGSHSAVAYVCGGQEYAYDSNTRRRLKDDWSNPETREELLRYSGADKFVFVAYTLYVRE